jgi:hypothetical protein
LRLDNDTNWFYNIIVNLRNILFPVSIYDLAGRVVGIAQDISIHPGSMYTLNYILFDAARLDTQGTYRIAYHGSSYTHLRMDETPNQRGMAVFQEMD